MKKFASFHGTITMINDYPMSSSGKDAGCYKLMTVQNSSDDIVNFTVGPDTYFVYHITLSAGDNVTGFYDANAPAILIFPPQFKALVMAKDSAYENVKVDYFNDELISSDNSLKLNIAPCTTMLLENNQMFTGNPKSRNLIVVYGPSTKSIPAQTVPYKIIVMCQQ
ncbi:hypothetical protein [Clostridium sp. JN-9]|uniref:hypothetical protein n=1 Tax=Clostridium sp. JN-9 TaxID=2507159 RepID=UPI000FFE0476|nr:hypothetical protein [Clostridium sp. JN-9]QAT39754.1 hypothetical protein EQM05_05540 [Clostridium sp. JN-9]